MARFQEFYKESVVPKLIEQFGYKSVMEVPRIEKITLNMGVGEAVADKKVMEFAVGDMQKIAGQRPVVTKSRKSIAGFKIRDGSLFHKRDLFFLKQSDDKINKII